jgi:hypothetical protein
MGGQIAVTAISHSSRYQPQVVSFRHWHRETPPPGPGKGPLTSLRQGRLASFAYNPPLRVYRYMAVSESSSSSCPPELAGTAPRAAAFWQSGFRSLVSRCQARIRGFQKIAGFVLESFLFCRRPMGLSFIILVASAVLASAISDSRSLRNGLVLSSEEVTSKKYTVPVRSLTGKFVQERMLELSDGGAFTLSKKSDSSSVKLTGTFAGEAGAGRHAIIAMPNRQCLHFVSQQTWSRTRYSCERYEFSRFLH